MVVRSHSIPADLVAGVRTGDESVIERGFHELFPALVAEADAELHDRASSVRVVERVFQQVLSGTPPNDAESLDRALTQGIHQAVVREQSRLAALRRFDHNEGVAHHERRPGDATDAAQAWIHIREARARAAAGHAPVDPKEGQHTAATHLAAAMDRDRRKWSIPLIVGGIVVLSVAGYGISKIDPRPSEKFVLAQLNATTARAINTPAGQVGNISLSDGTAMRIAAGSQLKVVNNFGEKLRAVLVKGTASFTIAADKKPFELRGKDVAISATEGKVDLRAEENRPALVRVVAGSPRITVGDSSWVASAGQTYVMENGIRPASAGEIDEAFAWMDGRFAASGTIREVVAAIRRWYDMDVGIGDNSIAEWPAQASGSLESLTSTIKTLEKSAKVKMIWQNRQMLLFRR
jgi:ferric-dicitrate binding protein FerR (iron transport regulator)